MNVRGAVASWLVRSTPDRVVRVRDLAGDMALCSTRLILQKEDSCYEEKKRKGYDLIFLMDAGTTL